MTSDEKDFSARVIALENAVALSKEGRFHHDYIVEIAEKYRKFLVGK